MGLVILIHKNFLKKINEKILVNYLGFDLLKIDEYTKLIFVNFISNFQSSKLEKLYIQINQKSILGLEMQRKMRKRKWWRNTIEFIKYFSSKNRI